MQYQLVVIWSCVMPTINSIRKTSQAFYGFPFYVGHPESKFRLRILPLQRWGHDGAQACRVC